jgi:hypothetical protein
MRRMFNEIQGNGYLISVPTPYRLICIPVLWQQFAEIDLLATNKLHYHCQRQISTSENGICVFSVVLKVGLGSCLFRSTNLTSHVGGLKFYAPCGKR